MVQRLHVRETPLTPLAYFIQGMGCHAILHVSRSTVWHAGPTMGLWYVADLLNS
jgi:hypothetical protein